MSKIAVTERSLPAGFEPLEHFVTEWALPDTAARMQKRLTSSIEAITTFYDTALPLGEAALIHLRGCQLGQLDRDSECLLKLMLALAEVAPAVEWYGQPEVPDGFPVSRIRFLRQIDDTAPQPVCA